MESLRDYSCAIATPAGRGKLEQSYQMPAKTAFPMNGTACPPSPIPNLQNCFFQDTAAPHMLQTPNNAIIIRFPNSSKVSIVYVFVCVCVLLPFSLLLRISDVDPRAFEPPVYLLSFCSVLRSVKHYQPCTVNIS